MNVPSRSAARRVALARLISLTGTQAALTALLFVLFERTGSSRWVSLALLVTFGTRGLLTPLGGSLGDRFDRRRLMIISELLGAGCFAALAFARTPLPLLALAFLATVAETPFFPAASAAVPNLVPAGDLAWANATIAFGSNVGYLAGPALGGVLVAGVGAAAVFLFNAATFVVSAILVATVRGAFSSQRTEEESYGGIRAGITFMMRQPTLRTATAAFAVFAMTVGSVLVAELPLAESFGVGSTGYGLLSTTFGIGALAGSLAGRFLTESNERQVLVACSLVTAAGFGSVALAPAFWLVLVAMLVSGASDGLVDVAVEVIFQRLSPDAVRSRVIAALEAVFLLGLAVSFLFAGPLVDALGAKAAYALAGAGCAVTALMLIPLVRQRRSSARLSPQARTRALE
ncbi:MAG TPA: MFS transporter [Actinomycetota bacterium]|nr:MFS transporter [Actinomycetota bacterium]